MVGIIDVDPVGCDIQGREGVALGGEVLIVGGHPRQLERLGMNVSVRPAD